MKKITPSLEFQHYLLLPQLGEGWDGGQPAKINIQTISPHLNPPPWGRKCPQSLCSTTAQSLCTHWGRGLNQLQRTNPTSPGSEAEGGEDAVVLELCESYKCGEGNSWLVG